MTGMLVVESEPQELIGVDSGQQTVRLCPQGPWLLPQGDPIELAMPLDKPRRSRPNLGPRPPAPAQARAPQPPPRPAPPSPRPGRRLRPGEGPARRRLPRPALPARPRPEPRPSRAERSARSLDPLPGRGWAGAAAPGCRPGAGPETGARPEATFGPRPAPSDPYDEEGVHWSALLAPATRAAWEQIQRSEGGTAQLLRRLEGYFSNVARNVQWTYLQPFVIVTANMILAVDIFDKFNFTGARVPWFDAIHEEFPRELESSISFPANFFKPPEEKEGPLVRPASRRTTPQTTRPGPGTEGEAPISR
nr:translation initiation factor IF-2 [Pan troglodytes]